MSEVTRFLKAVPRPWGSDTEHRLLEEIAFFEGRLREMGQSGDCAYEKALARSYTRLLSVRRGQLAALRKDGRRTARPPESQATAIVAQEKPL